MIWFKNYSLEEVAAYATHKSLVKLLNINITEIGEDYLCASMPVTPDIMQISGIMHGGATCVLVETAGSFASHMCLEPDKNSVGSYIQVNHLRPISSGLVIARAKSVHLGRQKHVWDVPVYAADTGKLIAKGELTCAVINQTP